MIKVYMVGGAIRDKFLGIPNKDIDFAVEAPSYEAMRDFVLDHGSIYLEHPQFFTIRAHVSDMAGWHGDADFVLCRKEGTYKDGRRPDSVSVGTIYDDLSRRDFTMNAIALQVYPPLVLDKPYANIISPHYDPFHGITDIGDHIIRTVGKPEDRFEEDALRMVRALRFAVTKDMDLHPTIVQALRKPKYLKLLDENISTDRKKDELMRMFKYSTIQTLDILCEFPEVAEVLLGDNSRIWLKPTTEKR